MYGQILQQAIVTSSLDCQVQPGLVLAPVSYESHPSAALIAADATDIHTHTTKTSTTTVFTAFTAALSTFIQG